MTSNRRPVLPWISSGGWGEFDVGEEESSEAVIDATFDANCSLTPGRSGSSPCLDPRSRFSADRVAPDSIDCVEDPDKFDPCYRRSVKWPALRNAD
jgi:hypothetical protein